MDASHRQGFRSHLCSARWLMASNWCVGWHDRFLHQRVLKHASRLQDVDEYMFARKYRRLADYLDALPQDVGQVAALELRCAAWR